MSEDHYLNMLDNLAESLSKTLESDDIDKMSEYELLLLLGSLQTFNRTVESIVGSNEDDFDVDKADLLLSEMDLFFSENETEVDSVLKGFYNLGKSLRMGALDEDQYKN